MHSLGQSVGVFDLNRPAPVQQRLNGLLENKRVRPADAARTLSIFCTLPQSPGFVNKIPNAGRYVLARIDVVYVGLRAGTWVCPYHGRSDYLPP
ncbi:MAG: hypothetical protein GXY41_07435 [Phycisphaerae bacterium]|nr:hypothetical protein [Phycisphaerae bacterium]